MNHPKNFKNRVGERFGRLVVAEFVGRTMAGNAIWSCLCDCGMPTKVRGSHLYSGNVQSCGCLGDEVHKRQTMEPGIKECCRCHQPKSYPVEFVTVKRKSGTYKVAGHCMECQKVAVSATRKKYKERYRLNVAQRRRERRNSNMQHVVDYLRQHPCVDCGEADWRVLQFDHIRGRKSFTISDAVTHRNWVHIAKEIEKCDVRCANCHQKRTIRANGFLEYVK